MRQWLVIFYTMLAFAAGPTALAQTTDPLSQYQQAVQLRMDDLVRSSAYDFFVKSHLSPAVISQVVATPKFNIDHDSARIASLDLRIALVSDHPPEVIRQLRLYIGQSLNREGFVLEHFAEPGTRAPHLSLTLDVRSPPSPILRFDMPGHWQELLIFGMILIALLSAILFGGYLLVLPFTDRKRRKAILAHVEETRTAPAAGDETGTGLPPLPASLENRSSVPESLDNLLAREQERQHFPVWFDDDGVRMADLQSIKKAFEVLPFDEAIDMLSCLDEKERNLILNKLNLNPSVRERIRREIVARNPVLSN